MYFLQFVSVQFDQIYASGLGGVGEGRNVL